MCPYWVFASLSGACFFAPCLFHGSVLVSLLCAIQVVAGHTRSTERPFRFVTFHLMTYCHFKSIHNTGRPFHVLASADLY